MTSLHLGRDRLNLRKSIAPQQPPPHRHRERTPAQNPGPAFRFLTRTPFAPTPPPRESHDSRATPIDTCRRPRRLTGCSLQSRDTHPLAPLPPQPLHPLQQLQPRTRYCPRRHPLQAGLNAHSRPSRAHHPASQEPRPARERSLAGKQAQRLRVPLHTPSTATNNTPTQGQRHDLLLGAKPLRAPGAAAFPVPGRATFALGSPDMFLHFAFDRLDC
jgi:hypothetical protein